MPLMLTTFILMATTMVLMIIIVVFGGGGKQFSEFQLFVVAKISLILYSLLLLMLFTIGFLSK